MRPAANAECFAHVFIHRRREAEGEMKIPENITSLAVPFTVGIAGGVALMGHCQTMLLSGGLHQGVSMLQFGVIGLSLYGGCRRSRSYFLYGGLFLLLGVFCALSSGLAPTPTDIDPLTRAALDSAQRLKEFIRAVPYQNPLTGSLVTALLTGDRGGLDSETISIFRASGASHLLALSGMHLGLIYLILLRLTGPMGNAPVAKKLRSVLLMNGTGFFALATGACPSIVRATLFIFINEISKLLGRKPKLLNTLCGALLIQLAVNPSVITSVGFQLSYLAMCGILMVYPVLRDWYPGERHRIWNLPYKMWTMMAIAISAQVFTSLPVWVYFGTFPCYFLLTNLIAVPLTMLLMMVSLAVLALSAFGLCPAILVMANDTLASALIGALQVISIS